MKLKVLGLGVVAALLTAVTVRGQSSGGTLINVDETTTTPTNAWKYPPVPDNGGDNLWDQRDETGSPLFFNENLGQAYAGETAPQLTMTVDVVDDLEGPGVYDVYVRFAGIVPWGPAAVGVAAGLGSGTLSNYDGNNSFLVNTADPWELYEAYIGRAGSFDTIVVRLDQYGAQRSMPDAVVFQQAEVSLANGLVAYWPLDSDGEDVIGGVVCNDTGTGDTGFESTAMVGKALRTDESGVANAGLTKSPGVTFGLTNRFTLSCWYRIDAIGSGSDGEKAAYARFHGIGYYNPDNASLFYFDCRYKASGTPTLGQVTASHAQSFGEWWHLVQTVAPDGTMNVWYQAAGDSDHDGVDATTTMAGYTELDTDRMTSHPIVLGLYEYKGPTATGGRIRSDEIAIWNRVLTDYEIDLLFDMGKAGTPILSPASGTVILVM